MLDGFDALPGPPRHQRLPLTPAPQQTPARELCGQLRAVDEQGEIRPLADIEHEMILMAIDHYAGQMSEVARRLGIGRSTLYRKLKDYGIDPETGRSTPIAF